MRVASFDIGFKNFAFCVENFTIPSFEKLKYDFDGTVSKESLKDINAVYTSGTIEELELLSFENDDDHNFVNFTKLLDTFKHIWNKVDVFLIERQIAFGKHANIKALRISQHCISYFSIIYGPFKKIIEFNSCYKTRLLGCELKRRKEKKNRKLFAIEEAQKIALLKNYNISSKFKKKDDISDCILMIQAFKILVKM